MDSTVSEVSPINSFTAYFVQGNGAAPYVGTTGGGPCNASEAQYTTACPGGAGAKYWRVCLQIITTNGPVVYTQATSPKAASILAFTRCAPTGESSEPTVAGSGTGVFSYTIP